MTEAGGVVLGRCYTTALDLLVQSPDCLLVHGYPTFRSGPHAGRKYGHAWLESPHGQVIDPDNPGAVFAVADYYCIGQIDPAECRRFTFHEAMDVVGTLGGLAGPWGAVPEGAVFAE